MSAFSADLQKVQEQRVEHALSRDPTVKFMLERLEEVRSNIFEMPCGSVKKNFCHTCRCKLETL
jgi:hypothetical protein